MTTMETLRQEDELFGRLSAGRHREVREKIGLGLALRRVDHLNEQARRDGIRH